MRGARGGDEEACPKREGTALTGGNGGTSASWKKLKDGTGEGGKTERNQARKGRRTGRSRGSGGKKTLGSFGAPKKRTLGEVKPDGKAFKVKGRFEKRKKSSKENPGGAKKGGS